ncbi:MAG: hypothetical protein JWN78_1336 [Bacteroidota bacterium]|nr:hypothetical protein [Bacteroidota bacterium]
MINRERDTVKMISNNLLFLFLMLFSFLSFSTNPVYFKTIPKVPLEIFINTTNDIFLLKKGMLERYDVDGNFLQNYGSIYINDRTQIISVNGFKTILFSPDYGKIIQLDNRLKEIDVIDALNLGTYIITCVGASYDNNFLWIWDSGNQRLVKLDKDHKPVFTSNTLSLFVGKKINPIQIVESGILLYLVDDRNGIFIFDNQGNYIKNIPIQNTKNLKIIEGKIYYFKDNCIYGYDNMTFVETRYTETPDLKNIQIGKTIIAGMNKDGFVEVWKF